MGSALHELRVFRGDAIRAACPKCGSPRVNLRYLAWAGCADCGIRFQTWWVGPPDDHLPLELWVLATFLLLGGSSVRQLQLLNISYRTAYRLARGIRSRLDLPSPSRRQCASTDVLKLLKMATSSRALEERAFRKHLTRVFWDFK